MENNCIYCKTPSELFETCDDGDKYYHCPKCSLYFAEANIFPAREEEKERYSQHNNNKNDPGYLKYLKNSTIFLQEYLKPEFKGLDFGCGPGPAMKEALSDLNKNIESFDPYFNNDKKLLDSKYDFITCIEAAEHFYKPSEVFQTINTLMKSGSLLNIRTEFYDNQFSLDSWWYRKDPTHVCFYNDNFFEKLAKKMNWKIIESDQNNMILFQKN